MKYYKLIDPQHTGTIVRTDGPSQQQYVPGEGWKESGILLQYFNDESDVYEQYKPISEREALDAIGAKGI